MKEKWLWIVFVVVVACAVAAVVGLWLRKAGPFPRVPDFKLIERSGRPIARRDLIGQVWVANFVFTRCAWSCPRMNTLMYELQRDIPEARYVSFTVDPLHDTPAHLATWVETQRLAKEGWHWVTGPTHESMQAVAHGFLLSGGEPGDTQMQVVHSEKFVLVDRYGRIRNYYPVVQGEDLRRNDAALQALRDDLKRLLAQPALPLLKLPAVNAGLNGTAAFFLIVGLMLIKARRIGAHKACMLTALAASTLFLVSYLTTHHFMGSTPYQGQGLMRPVYFTILISHTILAALIVPLAMITLYRAFREQFDRHRAIARWTLPIWLYVSITGVIIYFMLY